jgi:hypothetical protein
MGEKARRPKRGRTSRAREVAGKSTPVSVRLTPRTLYLAQLGATAQFRTLSSFAEWALNEAFRSVIVGEREAICALGEREGTRHPLTLAEKADQLWHTDAVDRLVALGRLFPALLDDSELTLWQLVQECDAAWHYKAKQEDGRWRVERTGPDLPTLRKYWPRFEEVAARRADVETLPRRVWRDGEDDGPPTSEVVDPMKQATDAAVED